MLVFATFYLFFVECRVQQHEEEECLSHCQVNEEKILPIQLHWCASLFRSSHAKASKSFQTYMKPLPVATAWRYFSNVLIGSKNKDNIVKCNKIVSIFKDKYYIIAQFPLRYDLAKQHLRLKWWYQYQIYWWPFMLPLQYSCTYLMTENSRL